MADPWDPFPSTVIFVHCGSRSIPGPCEPPRSQGPGSLQGQRGHRERIWRSECCPSPISCFKDRRHSALTALPALKSQTLQEWGEWRGAARGLGGGRTPEEQLPAMWIPVRVWLEGLGRGAVFAPASGLCCFSCGTSHSHNPFRLWTVTCQSNGLDLTLPPSIAMACQLHSSANPRHDPPRPRARMSITEGKRDLAITQMATLLIQGTSSLCQLPIFTSSFQGLNTTFGIEEIKV